MIQLDKTAPTQKFKVWQETYESKSDKTFVTQQLVWYGLHSMHIVVPDLFFIGSVICLDFLEADQDIRELLCQHVFHKGCLNSWYLTSHFGCPLCKTVFIQVTPIKDQETAVADVV
jgi:hypothetical protein